MFRLVYIIVSQLAKNLLPVASLFSAPASNFLKERKESKKVSHQKRKYWIHCASLGEYEMALPIIDALLEKYSLEDLVITIFSPSGYKQAIKGNYAKCLMYLPFDTQTNANQFYENYSPETAIFIRYDFWYNFINGGQQRGVNFYLVNGRFTENHFIFKWYGKAYRQLIRKFKGVYTSDALSSELLKRNDVPSKFTGDTRFDRVNEIAKQARSFPDIVEYIGNRKVLILGSSWKEEEDLVAFYLKSKPENLAVIIAPHDIKRSTQIALDLAQFLPKKYTEGDFSKKDSILILDTIGMLSSMYQYADIALIGGGFSGALHNILEPAVWGCHLSFGPITDKFPEAKALEDAGFATPITDSDKWVEEINILINNDTLLNEVKTKAKNYTAQNIGATSRIISSIQ